MDEFTQNAPVGDFTQSAQQTGGVIEPQKKKSSNPYADQNGQAKVGNETQFALWNQASRDVVTPSSKEFSLDGNGGLLKNKAFKKRVEKDYQGDPYRAQKDLVFAHTSMLEKSNSMEDGGSFDDDTYAWDDNARYRRDLYKEVFDGFGPLDKSRKAQAVLKDLKPKDPQQSPQKKQTPKPAQIGQGHSFIELPEGPKTVKDVASTQVDTSGGLLARGRGFAESQARIASNARKEEARQKRLAWFEERKKNPNFKTFYDAYDSMVQFRPIERDPTTGKVTMVDPAMYEQMLMQQMATGMQALIKESSSGKNKSKLTREQIEAYSRDLLLNDLHGQTEDEGILEWVQRKWDRLLATDGNTRNKEIDETIAGVESLGEWKALFNAYRSNVEFLRESQALLNSNRAVRNADGTITYDPKADLAGYMDVTSPHTKRTSGGGMIPDLINSMAGAGEFFSTRMMRSPGEEPLPGTSSRAVYQKNKDLGPPDGMVALALKHPVGFAERQWTTNERIKDIILSRLPQEALQQMQGEGTETDPAFVERLTPMLGDITGSMIYGGLRGSGAVASGVLKSAKLLKNTGSARKVLSLAEKIGSKLGTQKLVQAVESTPAGQKLLRVVGGAFKEEKEEAVHTLLTFTLASVLESKDRLTEEELLQSVQNGVIFPVAGAVVGRAFAEIGRRGSMLSKAWREGQTAIKRGRATGQDVQDLEHALEMQTAKARQVGYLIGQPFTNIAQTQIGEALTNDDYSFGNDESKLGMVQDGIIGLFFGAKAAKAYRSGINKGQSVGSFIRDYAEEIHTEADVRQAEKEYEKIIPEDGREPVAAETTETSYEAPDPVEAPAREETRSASEAIKADRQTVQDYADVMGVTRATVYNWQKSGRIKIVKEGNRSYVATDEAPQKPLQETIKSGSTTLGDLVREADLPSVAGNYSSGLEGVAGVPVEITDGDDGIYYDHGQRKITIGKQSLAPDPRMARLQILEEAAHAMSSKALEDPALHQEIDQILQKLRSHPEIKKAIKADNEASIRKGAGKEGKLNYFLSSPAEFVAGFMTGELSKVTDMVDRAFGQNAFKGLVESTGLNRALGDVFMTPESVKRVVDKAYESIGQNDYPDVLSQMSEAEVLDVLPTWRMAHKASGYSEMTSESVKASKELTDAALRIGLPEKALLDAASTRFADWESLAPLEKLQAATRMALALSEQSPKEVVEALGAYEQLLALEDDVLLDSENMERRMWPVVANILGMGRSQDASAWVADSFEKKGYEATYQTMKEKYLERGIAGGDLDAFNQMYSKIARLYGWTEKIPVVEAVVKNNEVSFVPRRSVSVPRNGNMRTAMAGIKNRLTGPWSRPLHDRFLSVLSQLEPVRVEGLRDLVRNGKWTADGIRGRLLAEDLYLIPKGYKGAMALPMEPLLDAIQDMRNESPDTERQAGQHWTVNEQQSRRTLDTLEEMVWWGLITSDSQWRADRPDFQAAEYKELNLKQILQDYRRGELSNNPMAYFRNLGETSREKVRKAEDTLNDNIRRIGAMLDRALTSQGKRMEPTVEYLWNSYKDSDPEWRSKRILLSLLDQIMTLPVDAGGKSFMQDTKMPSKYFSAVYSGDTYLSFKDLEHVDATTKWSGVERLGGEFVEGTTEARSQEQVRSRYGLHRLPDGRYGHKMLVLNDDMAGMIPGLQQLLGSTEESPEGKRLSKYADGASFYINQDTKDLHSQMLGKDPANVAGIKPSWYNDNGGQVSIWKTALHDSMLEIMATPETNPELAGWLHDLRKNGYSIITVESALKSDGSYRYRFDGDERGNGYYYNDKGRVVEELQSGKRKAMQKEDVAKAHQQILQRLQSGDSPEPVTRMIPLTGDDGLKLITTVATGLGELTNASAGLVGLHASLPNDKGGKAYEMLRGPIVKRNAQAVEAWKAWSDLRSGSGGKGQKRHFDLVKRMQTILDRDENPLGEAWSDAFTRMTMRNRLDSIFDSDGMIRQERLQAFNELYPGVFVRQNPKAPSLAEFAVRNAFDDARLTRLHGSGGIHLQPLLSPEMYFNNAADYLARNQGKMAPEALQAGKLFLEQLATGQDVITNDGVILPPLWKEGKVEEIHPYVFVTEDYFDIANAHIRQYNSKHPDEPLPEITFGSKTLLNLSPSDSLESIMPSIIAGIIPGKGKICAAHGILLDLQGRDFDADRDGLLFGSELFYDNGKWMWPDFWNELYSLGLHQGKGKVGESDLKLGQSALQDQIDRGASRGIALQTGQPLPYHYRPQKTMDVGYGSRSLEAGAADIGQAVNTMKRTVAALRTADQIGLEVYADKTKDGRSVELVLKNMPEAAAQLSVWKQSFVDPYDFNTYDLENMYLESILEKVSINGQQYTYGNLSPEHKNDVLNAYQNFLANYGGPTGTQQKELDYDTSKSSFARNAALASTKGTTLSPPADLTLALIGEGFTPGSPTAKFTATQIAQNYLREQHPHTVMMDRYLSGSGGLERFRQVSESITKRGAEYQGMAEVGGLAMLGEQVPETLLTLHNNGALRAAQDFDMDLEGKKIRARGGKIYQVDQEGSLQALTDPSILTDRRLASPVQQIRVVNRQGYFSKLTENPDVVLVSFDNQKFTGEHSRREGRGKILWVAKPDNQSPNSRGRHVSDLLPEITQALAEGKRVFINGNYGQDVQAKAAYDELVRQTGIRMEMLVKANVLSKPLLKYMGQPSHIRARILGGLSALHAQKLTGEKQGSGQMLTGHLLMDAMGYSHEHMQAEPPALNEYLYGAIQQGVLPRHPSGRTMEDWMFDHALQPQATVPDKRKEVSIEPTDPRKVYRTWSKKSQQEPMALGDHINRILGAKGLARRQTTMDALRGVTGAGMRELSVEAYRENLGDVKRIAKAFFGESLPENKVEELIESIGPGALESLQRDQHVYGDQNARKNAQAEMFLQALNAGEHMARDLKNMTRSESEFKRNWARRMEFFLNPWRRQNDTELLRLTSNFPTFAGRDVSWGAAYSVRNGETVTMTPNTVGTEADPLLWTSRNVVYEALPNLQYMHEHSRMHTVKDALQVWLATASKGMRSVETEFFDDRTRLQKLTESFTNRPYDSLQEDVSESMQLLGQSLSGLHAGKLDFGDMQVDATFDGIAESAATVSYGGRSLRWSGELTPDGAKVFTEMARDVVRQAGFIPGVDAHGKDGLVRVVRRLMMVKASNHIAAQYASSLASRVEHYLGTRRSDWSGTQGGYDAMVGHGRQVVRHLRKLAAELQSDDILAHLDMATAVDPTLNQELLSRYIQDIPKMSAGELDSERLALQTILDVPVEAGDVGNLIQRLQVMAREDPFKIQVTGRSEEQGYSDPGLSRMSARVYRYLADRYDMPWQASLDALSGRIGKLTEQAMLGINSSMRSGYMDEYSRGESMLARHAALSRFDLDGFIYDQEVNLEALKRLSMSRESALNEAEHGMETGSQITVEYHDGSEMRRDNMRILGVTTLPQVDGTPAALLWKSSGSTSSKLVIIPLDAIRKMHIGQRLGASDEWMEGKRRKYMQGKLGELQQILKDYGTDSNQDPIDAIVRDVVKLGDQYGELSGKMILKRGNSREIAKRLMEGIDHKTLPPGLQRIDDILSTNLVSRYLYGGLRNLGYTGLGVAFGVAAAPVFGFAGVVAGGAFALKNGWKLLTTHGLHYLGNIAGGTSKAWLLGIEGISGRDVLGALRPGDGGGTTPAGSASVARRFGGNNVIGDNFAGPPTVSSRPVAQLERDQAILRKLDQRNELVRETPAKASEVESVVAGMRQSMLHTIGLLGEYGSLFQARTWYDPVSKTVRGEIVGPGGQRLENYEEMNIDAINQALTFVTSRGVPNKVLIGLAEIVKSPNRMNSAIFHGVSSGEYQGAVKTSKNLDKSVSRQRVASRMLEHEPVYQASLDLQKVNMLQMMQTELLGKFDEKNPYHTTKSGKLGTLFSQWSRNFFIQTTEGTIKRSQAFALLTREMFLDGQVQKRLGKIQVGGSTMKAQLPQIAKMAAAGAIPSSLAIASATALALALTGWVSEEDTDQIREVEKLEREFRDDLQQANRIFGLDNIYASGVLGGTQTMVEMLALANPEEEALTPWRRYSIQRNAVQVPMKMYRSGGPGVGITAPSSIIETGLLALMMQARDADEAQWNYVEQSLVSQGGSVMMVTPAGLVIKVPADMAGETLKLYNKVKDDE